MCSGNAYYYCFKCKVGIDNTVRTRRTYMAKPLFTYSQCSLVNVQLSLHLDGEGQSRINSAMKKCEIPW